ncbi:MAG: hypothetical protein ACJAVO_001870 [Parvibaculaceae bacterium]|jgi:hypothetical protein
MAHLKNRNDASADEIDTGCWVGCLPLVGPFDDLTALNSLFPTLWR